MINVSPLVPEARETVKAAAQVYFEHTRPWFIGLLIHGSALKGGFIPGCSDIDFKLYLQDSAFGEDGSLPLELVLAIHRDLSKIDPVPFQYLQCYALPPHLTAVGQIGGDIGPIPGTYRMLLGSLPVPEPTPEQVRERAEESLATLQPVPSHLSNGLLDHGGGRLERHVRLLCTEVWPTLFNVLTCRAENPLEVWALPKDAAIARLPEEELLGKEIRQFHQNVRAYYLGKQSVDGAFAVVETGVGFLQAAKEWYRRHVLSTSKPGERNDNDDC